MYDNCRYGMVTDVVFDKADMKALVTFQAIDQAVNAVNELKIRPLFMNKKLMVSEVNNAALDSKFFSGLSV